MSNELESATDYGLKAFDFIRESVDRFSKDNPKCPAISMTGALMAVAFRLHAVLFRKDKTNFLFSVLDLASGTYDTMKEEEKDEPARE